MAPSSRKCCQSQAQPAIFAVQILALSNPDLARKLAEFRMEQEQAVRQKDASLRK